MRKWSPAKRSNTNYWVCSPAGGTYDRAIELSPETPRSTKFVVQRLTLKPAWYDWRLPSRHGVLYYYQQLVLRTAFRDSTPSALIRCWTANASGSMREECICRGLTHSDAAQEMQQVQPITSIPWLGRERSPLLLTALLLPFYAYTPQVGDAARRRHFTVEQVATMLSQEEEYNGLADFMFNDDDDEAPRPTCPMMTTTSRMRTRVASRGRWRARTATTPMRARLPLTSCSARMASPRGTRLCRSARWSASPPSAPSRPSTSTTKT